MRHSGSWNLLVCGDGSRCDVFQDPAGWSCCLNKGKRKQCPAYFPIMCNEKENELGELCGGGDHCCTFLESDCLAGRRTCPSGSKCPWDQTGEGEKCLSVGRVEDHQHSGEDRVMICGDGSRCNVDAEGWDCCGKRDSWRLSCPKDEPEMCGCMGCGAGDFCCSTKCDEELGQCSR